MDFHADFIDREAFLVKYLRRRITPEVADEFEEHLFACEDCFTELQLTEFLGEALSQSVIEQRQAGDVLIVDFTSPAEITAGSREYEELADMLGGAGDRRVLIDLGQVSRIDSAGLALLIKHYSRLARHNSSLRVIKPTPGVRRVLDITRVGPLLEAHADERDTLEDSSRN